MQTFDALLGTKDPARIWFLTGPGGIGKSTLLHILHERAAAQAVPCIYIDARDVRPNPPTLRSALDRAAGNQPLPDFCSTHASPLLLVDTFERWQEIEWWLREHFLPELPSTLRVIFAGRNAPQVDWQTDPGWRDLLRVTALTDLDRSEAGSYLSLRGVEGQSRQTLLDISGGRPLMLALGADMASQGKTFDERADAAPILEQMVERLTRDIATVEQRQALNAAAVVRTLNPGMLARMLDIEDAGTLYRWLSGLSFMEASADGLFPHDQVRETFIHNMIRHVPGRYETLVKRAFDWIVSRIEAADRLSWTEAARLSADAMYAMRQLQVVNHFLYPRGVSALYIEPARREEWPLLADMVAANEGAESKRWFEFWCARAPESVFAVRDTAGTPRGLFMRLDMETLSADDRAADPLTACLSRYIDDTIQPGAGAHLPFIRFWSTVDRAQSQSPEKTIILMAINSYNLMARDRGLRLTAQVFRDSPEWVTQAQALGITLLPNSDIHIGNGTWRIYFNDWRRESPTEYYRRFAERCIAFDAAVAAADMADDQPPVHPLDEDTFRAAIDAALSNYHNPEELQNNVLLGSGLVLSRCARDADEYTRMQILHEQISSALDTLENAAAPGPQHARILRRTYLQSTPRPQKQVASALGIRYSTYRRQLVAARAALARVLWRYSIADR